MFRDLCRLNDTSDNSKLYGYLNSSLINKDAFNPSINKEATKYWTKKGKCKQFDKKQYETDVAAKKRENMNCTALYIARCFDEWKDRDSIIGAHHFE